MMKLKNFSKSVALAGLISVTLPAYGQLQENVAIEGLYQPKVIETERIGTYPVTMKFELPPLQLNFAEQGIVSDFKPSILTMGITGWRTTRQTVKPRGYVDLNLGSWFNSNLSAGYRVINDSLNTLDLSLQFNSTSISKAGKLPENVEPLSRRFLYDGKISVGWAHQTTPQGLLTLGLDYRVGHFDYYGTSAETGSPLLDLKAPRQTVNQLGLDFRYQDRPGLPRGWHGKVAVGYFGYNSLYPVNWWDAGHISGQRETDLTLGAGYNLPLMGASFISLDAEARCLIYGSNDALPSPLHQIGNYGMITLRPAYRLNKANFDLRLGVVADITINADGNNVDSRYSLFHFAPDVSADFRKGKFGFHAGVTGGSRPQTIALREKYNLYQMPYLNSSQPTYTPFDAKLSFNVGPLAGLYAEAGIGYGATLHTPTGGWYQVMLGGYSPNISQLTAEGTPLYDYSMNGINLHGMNFEASLKYEYKDIFKASAGMTYTPQNGKKGVFNGYDRSRWTIDATASVRPVRKLRIDVGYNYRGVRNIYTYLLTGGPEPQEELRKLRLPDISDLNLGVTYSFSEKFHLYCRASNLLNRKVEILPALPSQGLTVCGGFDVMF